MEDKKKQHRMSKMYGSIYENYIDSCYYYDIVDLLRRLLLTGGLIMMGEQSVAQVFLGIVICAMWLSLLIHKKPYRSKMDNWVAIILAGHLLLTLVSGQALKLYDLTPGQDVYQRQGFGIVLVTVTILCLLLSLLSILASTPLLRGVLRKICKREKREKKKSTATNVTPVTPSSLAEKAWNGDEQST